MRHTQQAQQAARLRRIDRKWRWPGQRIRRVTPEPSAAGLPRKAFDRPEYESTRIAVEPGKRLLSQADTYAPAPCLACGTGEREPGRAFCRACLPASSSRE